MKQQEIESKEASRIWSFGWHPTLMRPRLVGLLQGGGIRNWLEQGLGLHLQTLGQFVEHIEEL
jgi:hypothetical protein